MEREPHVSIVTPVYNGGRYFERCIRSVVEQQYQNWSYTIVDNCSTDGSFEVALKASGDDSRIRVVRNKQFVGMIENHNNAFRELAPESKYCKLLSADDWIYPDYLTTMVRCAEKHPTAAMISCFVINKNLVSFPGLPAEKTLFDGVAVIRQFLRGQLKTFWLPTSVMYRADVVRAYESFYPGTAPSADLEACLEILGRGDLAFVHQVLAYERLHDESATAGVIRMNSTQLDRIRLLRKFGPRYLPDPEARRICNAALWRYYKCVLGAACFQFRNRPFWTLHSQALRELGYSTFNWRFFLGAAANVADMLLHPMHSLSRVLRKVRKGSVSNGL